MTGELLPVSEGEVAWDGTARFDVIPGLHDSVELWERVVPYGATAPLPDFVPLWDGNSPQRIEKTDIPLGSLYQVRLYDAGDGMADGTGRVQGALDFPSLSSTNGERTPIIDRCLQAPQIELFPGGTFVSASVAVCPASMLRIQLGSDPPVMGSTNLGVFERGKVASTAISAMPSRMHRLDVINRPFDRIPLLPGNDFRFVALAWTAQGFWDFAWNTTEVGQPPGVVTLKRRRVEVKLADLFIVDDSDELSSGEATFTLVVKRGQSMTNTQSFSTTVNSGNQVVGIPPFMKVDTGLEKIGTILDGDVSVNVTAHEDDSDSFPPDTDDYAHAYFGLLRFPSGPAEHLSNQVIEIPSTVDSGNEFKFRAQIAYSVSYA